MKGKEVFRYDENYQIDQQYSNESSELPNINKFFEKFYNK
jgi:hypothetical protein